jgi:uncharacterized protein YndB with AHSA1/START domain
LNAQNSPEPTLPFSNWLPFMLGAGYGFLLRLLFSGPSLFGAFKGPTVMSAAFALGVPFAVGAISVYFAERSKDRSVMFFIFAPWLAVSLFVGGTALALIEGSICIATALPLFLLMGSLGGLLMGLFCRVVESSGRTLYSVAALPLVLAAVETLYVPHDGFATVERSVQIAAPVDRVWQLINFPTDIHPQELASGLAYRIGVPYPIEARTLEPRVGGMRKLIWQRGISFDEQITDWQDQRYIAWTYHFRPDSFPAGSMDDHVRIGGEYFDLKDTSYTLTPNAGGTRLDVRVTFRATTAFNWYAVPVARFMIGDTAETILGFYQHRAEAAGKAG